MNLVGSKAAIVHFGCRLNQFESAGLSSGLTSVGFQKTTDLREADVVVINTCTVTNKADYKNRAAIRRAHRLNPQAKIIVTGCYATTDAEDIRRLPGVYRVISNNDKSNIPQHLSNPEQPTIMDRFAFSSFTEKSRATLKIQDGCNKSCSYCKIPQARGKGVSRAFDETLADVVRLIDQGYHEIILTGVNIGWYESDGKSYYDLVEAILNVPGQFKLRVSSIEPGDVNERYAEFYAHEKMAKFLHIPLQSGSKNVLRAMRRGYTPREFERRVDLVRCVSPSVHVGTDVIVGFPTETNEAFQETLDRWRADWESLDTGRYLAHYSKRFSSGKENFGTWSRHKLQVNSAKQWIKVAIRNLSMFRSPGKDELVVVTFDQDYRSSNLNNEVKKRQYWIREDGQWRIVFEGAG